MNLCKHVDLRLDNICDTLYALLTIQYEAAPSGTLIADMLHQIDKRLYTAYAEDYESQFILAPQRVISATTDALLHLPVRPYSRNTARRFKEVKLVF